MSTLTTSIKERLDGGGATTSGFSTVVAGINHLEKDFNTHRLTDFLVNNITTVDRIIFWALFDQRIMGMLPGKTIDDLYAIRDAVKSHVLATTKEDKIKTLFKAFGRGANHE